METLAGTLRRALAAYSEPEEWAARRKFAMQQEFSWERSGQEYMRLYLRLVNQS